jgi:hypothetical protein
MYCCGSGIWCLFDPWTLDRIENQKPQHGTVSPYFLVKCSFIGEFEVAWTYLLNAFISFSVVTPLPMLHFSSQISVDNVFVSTLVVSRFADPNPHGSALF